MLLLGGLGLAGLLDVWVGNLNGVYMLITPFKNIEYECQFMSPCSF